MNDQTAMTQTSPKDTKPLRPLKSGGGWKAINYSLKLARRVGLWNMWKALRSKNACKTCAVGMGGQLGGMVNEGGYFPEVCKKSFQAMASDMQPAIPREFFSSIFFAATKAMTPRQLEASGRLTEPLYLPEGATHYQPIGWDQALGFNGRATPKPPGRSGASFMPAAGPRTKPGFCCN